MTDDMYYRDFGEELDSSYQQGDYSVEDLEYPSFVQKQKKPVNTDLLVGAAAAIAILYILTKQSTAVSAEETPTTQPPGTTTTQPPGTTTTQPPGQILRHIAIPADVYVTEGSDSVITAECQDVNRQPITCPGTLTWSIIDGSSFITVTPTGLNTASIHGRATGIAHITASYG